MPLVTASLSLGSVGQFVGRCKEPLCMCDMLHKGGRHVVELYEVAELLKVTPRAVQEWIRTKKLPAMRYGRVLRIRAEDLAKFGRRV